MGNEIVEQAAPKQEQKPKNKYLPIIIAAIFAIAVLVATIIIVLVFAIKPETPEQPVEEEDINEVNSYVILEDYNYSDSLIEYVDSVKVISSYSDLQDFYDGIGAHYATSYPLPPDDAVYNEPTDCINGSGDTDCGYIVPIPASEKPELYKPDELNEDYFEKHDLIATYFENYRCGGSFNRISDVSKNGDVVTIEIGYDGGCGPCSIEVYIILVEVEKDLVAKTDIIRTIEIEENNPMCDPNVVYKPMIYLYPENETEINVKLGRPDLLTTTYPQYDAITGWQVIAKPDGTIYSNNREYYGLYWEGFNSSSLQNEGFIVAGKDTAKFFEEKLAVLGLNDREANEFIVYWLPKMEGNKYNYIRFATTAEIEEWMPLKVSPKPDTTIRILMEYKPLNQKIVINEQKLEKTERKGYSVIEWGGTEIK